MCIGLFFAFAAGWPAEQNQSQNTAATIPGKHVNRLPNASCRNWQDIRVLNYSVKTLYLVVWQVCSDNSHRERVRVMNDDSVVFEYVDYEILRTELLDLLGNHVPQLLIITRSPGTDAAIGWHLIGDSNGELHEWKIPDYDAASQNLLRADEDFCCKDWNLHLAGRAIFLARGIYHKGEGNCCPSRGGILVHLEPEHKSLALAKVERLSRSEYYKWRSQPFCLRCTLK
jgi:hypothetical protein